MAPHHDILQNVLSKPRRARIGRWKGQSFSTGWCRPMSKTDKPRKFRGSEIVMPSKTPKNNAKAPQNPLQDMGSIFPVIVQHSPVGMLLVDKAGKIAHTNPKAEAILGYSKEELLGQSMEVLLPQRIRKAHVAHRSNFMADPKPRPMGVGRLLFALHKDGREVPVEIGLVPIQTADGAAVLASMVDMTAFFRSSKPPCRAKASATNAR